MKKQQNSYNLRVSVLQQCQCHCPYCLPVKLFNVKKKSWLSVENYSLIAKALSFFNIKKIRFTGGEPLLRVNFFDIVKSFVSEMKNVQIGMTTNGHYLGKKLFLIKKTGISSVTIHMDSLNNKKNNIIMGKCDLNKLFKDLKLAKKILDEVKINVVVQRGVNDDELINFLFFSLKLGIQVRFIELMDTGISQSYIKKVFISKKEILKKILLKGSIEKIGRKNIEDPSVLYKFNPINVVFGVIASETEKFCFQCNRLRLSSEGNIYGCLYQDNKISLIKALKSGANEHQIKDLVSFVLKKKRSFHPSVEKTNNFSMAHTGG